MGVAPALTSDELAALAGPSAPRWYAVYDTTGGDNLVATAQVDAPDGLTYPLTSLPVKNTSAGWGNIQFNQTVLVGSTPGGSDKGIYRVRKVTPSLTAVALMVVGENDSGSLNIALRRFGIADDDYVTVLYSFEPFGVNPRIDYSGTGTDARIFEDWDNSLYQYNRYPPPIVNLFFNGQPNNYATHIYSQTSKTFDIDVEIILWPTASSVDWAFTLPSGWTLNSGSLTGSGTTASINVTAPHSADPYVLHFRATDDNDSIFDAYRKVWIKSNTYPPLSIVRIESGVDDRTGSRRTITLNSLVGAPPGAMWHLFDMGSWNGTDVPTAIQCFTGYVQRRREITDIGVANVSLDLIGPSYVLGLIGAQSQIMTAVNGDPANWQQVYYLLSYLDFIIWWILYQRASGFLQCFNYTSFGLTNTQKRMTDWRLDTGTLLSQIQAQAVRFIGGNFGCDPTGEFMLRRHVSRIPWSERGDVPIRATLTASKFKNVELDYEEHPTLRRLRGECFTSDGLTVNTPVWCDAPPVPGQGAQEDKFERLICDSADELYEGNGNEYQARNNPYASGSIQIPKNWAVFYPAQMSRVGLDIAPRLRYDGQEYDGYVLPIEVSYTYNSDGTIDTNASIEAETVGLPGVDVPIPVPDATQYNSHYQAIPFSPVPLSRSLNPNPAGTSAGAAVLPRTGALAFCGTSTQAFVATNFTGTPIYRDVTPSGLGNFTIRHGMLQVGGKRAWLLVSDGTDSKVYTTANVFALPRPTWSAGSSVTGVYNVLRLTDVAGEVAIYTSDPDGVVTEYDFTQSDGGFTAYPYSGGAATWHPLTGWQSAVVTDSACAPSPDDQTSICQITKTFSSERITSVRVIGTTSADSGSGGVRAVDFGSFGTDRTSLGIDGVVGAFDNTIFVDETTTAIFIYVNSSCFPGAEPITISKLIVTSGSGGNANARYSSNNGGTFGSAVTVGGTPGPVGGFDLQHLGSVSYAGATGKVRKATTLGGSFSDDQSFGASPILIEIPWSKRNATTLNNTGSSPEYVVGLGAPDSGHTLFWVESGSPTNITPTIGGNPGIPAGANSLTTYLGKYIAFLAAFGGTKHLVTSKNGGTSWTDRGALDASYARVRRLASSPGQLFLAGNVLDYSSSFGVAKVSKTKPSSAALVFFEAYY